MTELFSDVAEGRPQLRGGVWVRRAILAVLAAASVLGLADVFGQQPTVSRAAGAAATLELSAPARVRGGLFFESRVTIRATRRVAYPRLVLDRGWTEGIQFNSAEPNPASEASRNGRVVLSYPALAPGDLLRIWMEFEVNPTTVGTRPYGLELDDATTPVARIARTITSLP
jgi:hypothetical protein